MPNTEQVVFGAALTAADPHAATPYENLPSTSHQPSREPPINRPSTAHQPPINLPVNLPSTDHQPPINLPSTAHQPSRYENADVGGKRPVVGAKAARTTISAEEMGGLPEAR